MYRIFNKIGKNQNVICTIATNKYFLNFRKYALKSWMLYAKKYNLGVIVFFKNIDQSKIAKKSTWQKYLIGDFVSKNISKKIKNILYLDSDILINPNSPNIFKYHNNKKISVTSAHKNLPYPLQDVLKRVSFFRRKYYSKKYPLDSSIFFTPEQKYKFHNFKIFDDFYCAGMFIFNCKNFNSFLKKKLYEKYSKNFRSLTGGDQPSFNFEVNNFGRVKKLDYKFQAIWLYEMAWKYPFLYRHQNKKYIKECISTSLMENYFLHFAGPWLESDMLKAGSYPYDKKSYKEAKILEIYNKKKVKPKTYGLIKPKN